MNAQQNENETSGEEENETTSVWLMLQQLTKICLNRSKNETISDATHPTVEVGGMDRERQILKCYMYCVRKDLWFALDQN